jgi:GT2 family glycosyltransferase
MADSCRIGVVTVTFNSALVISDFMNSLLKQKGTDFILYVVDNASSDETLNRISESCDARVVVICNPTNLGVAEGNNIGIRAAMKDGCHAVLLINNDTVFGPDLLSELSQALTKYECAMVVPKIMYFEDPERIWCAGGYFQLRGFLCRHFGVDEKDNGQYDQPHIVQYSPTCCMLIRREVFEQIGLMDSAYFVYYDDTDFCYRACRAGIKLFYVPSSRVLHKVSSLTGSQSGFSLRYGVRNHVYYFLKHFPRWRILLLPVYQLYLVAKFGVWMRAQKDLWLAEKAFWEGISLSRSRSRAREQNARL